MKKDTLHKDLKENVNIYLDRKISLEEVIVDLFLEISSLRDEIEVLRDEIESLEHRID